MLAAPEAAAWAAHPAARTGKLEKRGRLKDEWKAMEIKILRRVRAESPRRPPRHRRGACSMAWRYRFLTARPSQDGRVIVKK